MDQPAWLAEAWREFGQAEKRGSASNPRIVKLYKDVGHGKIHHDDVAWCAAFLGACLERAGQGSTRSLMARSYVDWGMPLAEARTGAVAVLKRTADPALGHVGFVVGETDGALLLLGGNQDDAVSVAQFPKSRLISLRWPTENLPDGVETDTHTEPNGPPTDLFGRALAHVLEMEGGYTDDSHDPGGPTNKGITLAVYAAWKGEVLDAETTPRLLATLQHIPASEVVAIYHTRYWRTADCERLPEALAVMQFDAAVNHGPGSAVRILQEAVGTTPDGEIGPLTERAIAATPVLETLEAYAEIRRERYRAMPHFWRFGRGWLRRVDKTLALASQIAAEYPTSDMKGTDTMSDDIETQGKWWGGSLTIWGAFTTGLAAILPVLGPLFGLDVTGELVRDLGQQIVAAAQAIVAVLGTVMTIMGRARATRPIERRPVSLRL